ncbi:hypothetical protein DL93DRAFT_2168060 [Clavulina sp. PMI_390]|nr:hypothetical protein DL93DRAFT_2168060 [Clavulina sp. PMI_390]
MTAENNKIVVDAREHPVVGVTVYQSDRAIVQRRFSLDVKSGQNDIAIKYLPTVLDGDSIRVETGTTSFSQTLTVFDVVSSTSPYNTVTYTTSHVIPDTPEVNALREEKSEKDMLLQILERDEALLNAYSDSLRSAKPEEMTAESIVSFMDMRLERQTQLWKKKMQLQKDIKAITNKVTGLGHTITTPSAIGETVPSALRSNVTVVLSAEEPGPIELVISYLVTRASWSSLYDVRGDLAGTSRSSKSAEVAGPVVRIQYRANITQSTGEDWKNASLTLSTATPLLGTSIPKIQPWHITAWQPSDRQRWTPGVRSTPPVPPVPPATTRKTAGVATRRPHESDPDDLFGTYSSLSTPTPLPAASATSGQDNNVKEGTISSTFGVDGVWNIPSDGTSHKVSIANIDLDAEVEWIVVPRNSPSAFLQCRLKNQSSYQFIAGPSAVFLDGNFVAKSTIPNVAPSELFTCSLGVDPFVRVTFHPQSKVSNTMGGTGLSSYIANNNPRMNVTSFKQRITIKNIRANTAIGKMVVHERVPVSEDARIKVLVLQPSEAAIGPVTGMPPEDLSAGSRVSSRFMTVVEDPPKVKPPSTLVARISNNVSARWAQKEEEGGGSGGARGDGVLEWIIHDLQDSVDLNLTFEVTCPSDVRFVDAH